MTDLVWHWPQLVMTAWLVFVLVVSMTKANGSLFRATISLAIMAGITVVLWCGGFWTGDMP